MAFDVKALMEELSREPLLSPYPAELSRAVVNDVFRRANLAPVPLATWTGWEKGPRKRLVEQAGMLAHALASTSLRAETVRTPGKGFDTEAAVDRFFASVEPLTAEMVRSNAFRQEEFLRKWIAAVGGRVAGETPEASRSRLETLDYGGTLREYERAERARKEEADRRAAALRKAREEAEAAARGWRE